MTAIGSLEAAAPEATSSPVVVVDRPKALDALGIDVLAGSSALVESLEIPLVIHGTVGTE